MSFDRTEFGRYRRFLQGASFSMDRSEGQVKVFGAVSKGRWVTRRLVPVEGYQGAVPSWKGGTPGQVVAGSERVYLNGQLLHRGDGQDYVVDYDRGLLTFTPARPITGESRLTVEYQYLADGLRRRLMGVQTQVKLGADQGHLGATFIREADQVALNVLGTAASTSPGHGDRRGLYAYGRIAVDRRTGIERPDFCKCRGALGGPGFFVSEWI